LHQYKTINWSTELLRAVSVACVPCSSMARTGFIISARRQTHANALLPLQFRLSVCLSVTLVIHTKTVKISKWGLHRTTRCCLRILCAKFCGRRFRGSIPKETWLTSVARLSRGKIDRQSVISRKRCKIRCKFVYDSLIVILVWLSTGTKLVTLNDLYGPLYTFSAFPPENASFW